MKLTLDQRCPLKMSSLPDTRADGTWFCTHCTSNVVNLSSLSEQDARDVLDSADPDVQMCGEWVTDRRGNVLFNVVRAAAVSVMMTGTAAADGGDLPTSATLTSPLIEATDLNRTLDAGSAGHADTLAEPGPSVDPPVPSTPRVGRMPLRNPPPSVIPMLAPPNP